MNVRQIRFTPMKDDTGRHRKRVETETKKEAVCHDDPVPCHTGALMILSLNIL